MICEVASGSYSSLSLDIMLHIDTCQYPPNGIIVDCNYFLLPSTMFRFGRAFP